MWSYIRKGDLKMRRLAKAQSLKLKGGDDL